MTIIFDEKRCTWQDYLYLTLLGVLTYYCSLLALCTWTEPWITFTFWEVKQLLVNQHTKYTYLFNNTDVVIIPTRFDLNWRAVVWCDEIPPPHIELSKNVTWPATFLLLPVWSSIFSMIHMVYQNANKPVFYCNTAKYDCIWLTCYLKETIISFPSSIIYFMGTLEYGESPCLAYNTVIRNGQETAWGGHSHTWRWYALLTFSDPIGYYTEHDLIDLSFYRKSVCLYHI